MSPLDLIRSRDGSMSLTKLAASTFHCQLAVTVAGVTVWDWPFSESMWLLYAGFAVGHAAYDKTAAQIKDSREKRLAAQTQQPPTPTGE